MAELPAGVNFGGGGLLTFFSQLVEEGLSQNRSLAAFRAAGGTGNNRLLRDVYNQARGFSQGRPAGWSLEPGVTPGAGDFIEWETGTPGQYVYPVALQVYDPETRSISGWASWVSSDHPISEDEATLLAGDQLIIAQQAGEPSASSGVPIGGGLYQQPRITVPIVRAA